MIFLSHNYKDKPLIREIAQNLEKVFGREKVFYDEWSIQPGDSIIDKMNTGISVPDLIIPSRICHYMVHYRPTQTENCKQTPIQA